ncbi:DUF6124 family protein [Pseudomonas brassicacearum]|uniref:DUF6124 family protein n=1 Tax=Pseudomonas brassicacearum TaxID=930166 RepID=UPI001E09A2F3|nr:DUF6124 family protein [Pseudomonas brassicacearum]CAH0255731.1 hypothetical protein SRABI06_03257 [Pseudomonas brassicacearum]
MVGQKSDSKRIFRRALAVAGWEEFWLIFSRRCQFSVRAVVAGIDTECLLTNLSETLACANATISDLAFELEGSRRHVALGVQQLIELSELLANRVLDEWVPVPEG